MFITVDYVNTEVQSSAKLAPKIYQSDIARRDGDRIHNLNRNFFGKNVAETLKVLFISAENGSGLVIFMEMKDYPKPTEANMDL